MNGGVSRFAKVLLFLVLLLPASLWVAHKQRVEHERKGEVERRKFTLLGTWDVLDRSGKKKNSSLRFYRKFNPDGTGEEIWEENGKRARAPFTYTVADIPPDTGIGIFQVEITCDWTYYKGRVVTFNDSRVHKDVPPERVSSFLIYVGHDRNHISQNPYGSVVGTQTVSWSRVQLKPLLGEVDRQQGKIKDKRLRLIGTWDVLQEEEWHKKTGFKWYWSFNEDGTGEEICQESGGRTYEFFTYKIIDSRINSYLEITRELPHCKDGILSSENPCNPYDAPQYRLTSTPIFFGLNRNRIYLTPDLSDEVKGTTHWQRVVLKPLAATVPPLIAPANIEAVQKPTPTRERKARPNEVVWVTASTKLLAATDNMVNAMRKYIFSSSGDTKPEWFWVRTSFSNAVSEYERIPMPPSLANAGRLTRELIAEANEANKAIDKVETPLQATGPLNYYGELPLPPNMTANYNEVLHHLAESQSLSYKIKEEIERLNNSSTP